MGCFGASRSDPYHRILCGSAFLKEVETTVMQKKRVHVCVCVREKTGRVCRLLHCSLCRLRLWTRGFIPVFKFVSLYPERENANGNRSPVRR